MSVQVSYWKQILFVVVFFIVILSSIEGMARIYNYFEPNCDFIKNGAYENLPFSLKRSICLDNENIKFGEAPYYHLIPNQHLETININSEGFRGPEITDDPNNSAYRIFAVGGSTTFGDGATSDNTTYPSYLQNMFETSHKNIQVINAGINYGYSYTETNLIKNEIIRYHPNMIIVFDGWNDINRPFGGYNQDVRYDFLSNLRQDVLQNDIVFPKVVTKLYRGWSESLNFTISPFDQTGIDQKALIWKERWSNICNLGKQDHFETIIILQPFDGTGHKHLTSYEKRFYTMYDLAKMSRYYQKYADALQELNGTCRIADFQNIFDNFNGTVYLDDVHTDDEGNKVIANDIYSLVSPLVEKSDK